MVQLPVVWTLLPRKTSGARNPRVPRRSGIRGEGVAMPKSMSQPLLSWIKFKTRKLSTQLPERKTENSGAWHLGGWDRLYKVCKKKNNQQPQDRWMPSKVDSSAFMYKRIWSRLTVLANFCIKFVHSMWNTFIEMNLEWIVMNELVGDAFRTVGVDHQIISLRYPGNLTDYG